METLISEDRYFASPRANFDMAVMIEKNTRLLEMALQESACFAAFVTSELAGR